MYFAYTWARPPLHCLLAVFIRRSRLFKVRSVKRDWSINAYSGLCVQKAKEGCDLVYGQKYFDGFRISTEIDHRDGGGTRGVSRAGNVEILIHSRAPRQLCYLLWINMEGLRLFLNKE